MTTPEQTPQDISTEIHLNGPDMADPRPQVDFDYDYDPNNDVTADQQVDTRGDSFLSGPRQTGDVPLPNGNTARHEITRDGMKQTRIVRDGSTTSGYKSEKDFRQAKRDEADRFEDLTGIRPAGAPPRVEAAPQIEKLRFPRVKKAAKAVLHTLQINHPSK